jgi:hypothetical protein
MQFCDEEAIPQTSETTLHTIGKKGKKGKIAQMHWMCSARHKTHICRMTMYCKTAMQEVLYAHDHSSTCCTPVTKWTKLGQQQLVMPQC